MPSIAMVEAALAASKTDSSKLLGVTVGSHKVTPGIKIPKADAQSPPELSFNGKPDTTYLMIALDVDAPFPSFQVLGPILHWIQPDLKSADTTGTLTSTSPFVANYIGPAPPPMSGPHRYCFMLYEQPADFDAKKYAPPGGQKMGNGKRMFFDLGAFEKKAGLGEIVAANYFVSN